MKFLQTLALAMLVAFSFAVIACDDGGDDSGQNSNEDVVAEDDIQNGGSDAQEPGDDSAGQTCQDECDPIGAQECVDGATFRVCEISGDCAIWGAPQACAEGETCNGETGYCAAEATCTDECANVGVKTCNAAGDKVLECQVGTDGCNVLAEVETCGEGTTCTNGACSGGGGGDNDCLEIVLCASNCMDQTCVQNCASTASPEGINAYNAMGQCVQSNCAAAQTASAQQKCLLENCDAEYTGCVGPYGTTGCLGILQCFGTCTTAQCQLECVMAADKEGQTLLWDLQLCLEENCADCGQDQTCLQNCVQQSCMNEYMGCQNNQ